MSKAWQGHVIEGTRFVDPASGVAPRHVLCAIGVGLDLDVLTRVVAEAGGEDFELDEFQQEPDPRMRECFDAALESREATDDDEFGESDWAAVDAHDSVVYVLSPPISQATGLDVSRRTLAVTAALLAHGATAVKNESSGVTGGRERWLALASEAAAAETVDDLALALARAWVASVIYDGEVFYSCGMHLLGEADVELSPPTTAKHGKLLDWMVTLRMASYYVLTEQPEHGIQNGEGFRITQDAPRWIMHRVECERYEDDDFLHNPYGYWRLSPADVPRRKPRLRKRTPRTAARRRG